MSDCCSSHEHDSSGHDHHGVAAPSRSTAGSGRPLLRFAIRGLDCAEEIAVLEREVVPVIGAQASLGFDVLSGTMSVFGTLPPGRDAAVIVDAVARTGMRAELVTHASASTRPAGLWSRHGRIIMTAASGLCMLAGFSLHAVIVDSFMAALHAEGSGLAAGVPMAARIAYLAAVVCGAWFVAPKAWYALRSLRPDMNLLMLVAVAGAIGIGDWLEAATVSFLFALSLALEAWSVGRARRAVQALMDLSPQTVALETIEGTYSMVAPSEVATGARILVKPGERIALDGRIARGESQVNQAPITGESMPVAKGPGDQVFAGSVNGEGALLVETTAAASDTVLAHIVEMVANAQSKRGPSEQWVERFARIYTPVVMVLALLLGLLPPLLMAGEAWDVWFYRALVLLVIACPCALVISTPISIVAALAAAARQGVLVKGGAALESASHLTAVALDKTGTLTSGRPKVVEMIAFAGHDERELLERAAALEGGSTHPLARAIVEHAQALGIEVVQASDAKAIPGKGAEGRIGGRSFWVGSHRYLEEKAQETPEVHRALDDLASAGRTVVVVGNEAHVCGVIALGDDVRAEAAPAIRALEDAHVKRIVMLTGDNHATAATVARLASITEYRAELLPADKVAAIEELIRNGERVAMIGDGINDAPAMARASLGIAMGAAGSDAAIETADVALMSDDLSKVAWLMGHARRTLKVIRQNIGFALGIKALFVVLTLFGYSSLWAAIAADMGASLLVVFNGLRLLDARA